MKAGSISVVGIAAPVVTDASAGNVQPGSMIDLDRLGRASQAPAISGGIDWNIVMIGGRQWRNHRSKQQEPTNQSDVESIAEIGTKIMRYRRRLMCRMRTEGGGEEGGGG